MSDVLGVSTDYLLRDSIPVDPPLVVEASSRHLRMPLQFFGAKLRFLRARQGFTQSELMQQLRLASQGYISKLEAGAKEPSPDLAAQIAELFGVTTEYLLCDAVAVDLA
jgi:DNA-binding XRE family transcriptional regulator